MSSFGLASNSTSAVEEAEIDSSTPWMAASEGNLPLLQTSLQKLNLPATAADENGYTLVHAACSYNKLQILQWLVSQGANLQAVDHEGDSALHYAGNVETCQALTSYAPNGVDNCHRNKEGKTALEAKQEELTEMMEDEDVEDDDEDLLNLKSIVQYLTSLQS